MQHTSSSTSRAIAMPPRQQLEQVERHDDMALFSPDDGRDFNPANYVCAMFGSPCAFSESSSYGSSLELQSTSGFRRGSIDQPDVMLSSSVDCDQGVFMEAQNAFCRDYTCCGLHLEDLHALVEHFEDAHVVDVDRPPQTNPNRASQVAFVKPTDGTGLNDRVSTAGACIPSAIPSDCLPITTHAIFVPAPCSLRSRPSTTLSPSPTLANDTAGSPQSFSSNHDLSFATPSQYSGHDERPGAVNGQGGDEIAKQPGSPDFQASPGCHYSTVRQTTPCADSSSMTTRRRNTFLEATPRLSHPASSLLLRKPFRCPKPNCNKSYKQSNGLKYHMTYGVCSFEPAKDVQAVQTLLEEKGLSHADNVSETDVREVVLEAERRLRPFACSVGECKRRYKNMNGLRYHYQHTGEHGARGLRLLASRRHEGLNRGRSHPHKVIQAPGVAARERGDGILHPVDQPFT